jgi:hypothetical protein
LLAVQKLGPGFFVIDNGGEGAFLYKMIGDTTTNALRRTGDDLNLIF